MATSTMKNRSCGIISSKYCQLLTGNHIQANLLFKNKIKKRHVHLTKMTEFRILIVVEYTISGENCLGENIAKVKYYPKSKYVSVS
jgi:hypothetical protein